MALAYDEFTGGQGLQGPSPEELARHLNFPSWQLKHFLAESVFRPAEPVFRPAEPVFRPAESVFRPAEPVFRPAGIYSSDPPVTAQLGRVFGIWGSDASIQAAQSDGRS